MSPSKLTTAALAALALCVTGLAPAPFPRRSKADAEAAKLQGTWDVTEYRTADLTWLPREGVTHRLVIESGQFRLWCGNEQGGSIVITSFTLDPARSPRHFDLALSAGGKRASCHGIYEIDGGELKLCFPTSPPWDRRPAGFAARDGFEVYRLKRAAMK